MRLTVLLLVTLFTGASWEPQPKLDGVSVEPQGTNVIVRGWFRSPGNPDSNITTLTGPSSQRHALLGTALRDSFFVARPAAGATISGNFCVQSKKVGWVSAPAVCRAWIWTEPSVLPPPVVDSVKTDTLIVAVHILPPLRPIALHAPADTVFCAVYEMGNGSVGYRGARHPACEGYPGLPITAAGQAKLDRDACTAWTVVPVDPQGRALTVTATEPCGSLATVGAR